MPRKVRSKRLSRSKPRYSRKRISKQRRRSNLRKNTRRRNLRKNTRKRNTRKGGRRLRWPRRRVAEKQEEEEEEDWSPPQEQDCGGQDLQYCDKLLCGLGINDRKTWSAWIKQNHPDKNMGKSEGDLVGRVQNCKNSDCYCPR